VERYRCSRCGNDHEGPPLGYDRYAPHPWYGVPATERRTRCVLDDEACVIDGRTFFLKGNIYIPLLHTRGFFTYAVWVAVSRVDFARAVAMWQDPERSDEPLYEGRIATNLSGYPQTLYLPCRLHSRRVGSRFYVELERTLHPLAVEHREGITQQRLQTIAELAFHEAELSLTQES
jgi:hypothetical protein